MKITDLDVSGYRCFNRLTLGNLDKVVCLVGANGSGKSSLLELIDQTIGRSSDKILRFMKTKWGHPEDEQSFLIHLEISREDDEALDIQRPIDLFTGNGERYITFRFDDGRITSDETLRNAIVVFSSNRSFLLKESTDSKVNRDFSNWEFYRGTNRGNFQSRADVLTARLAVLLRIQQSELAKKWRELDENGEAKENLRYDELPQVRQVFDDFFEITGKTFASPETRKDGNTIFNFQVPWSKEPLPLSALSSGEQWVLMFFVEMELNMWKHHIILIDEIETHLHPELALQFVRALEKKNYNNQYWLTTHSPILAQHLRSYTIGLVLKDDKTVEQVSAQSISVFQSLAGEDVMIPAAKTLVFLEGSKPKRERYSVDFTFFKELQELKVIPKSIQFISVGTASSVEEFHEKLKGVQDELGVDWNIYAIRDRDAMPDETRSKSIQKYGETLWIWKRGSIEGYLIEPKVLRSYFEGENIDNIPSEDEIEERILELLVSNKNEILERFENYLVLEIFPSRTNSSLKWLEEAPNNVSKLKKKLDEFETDVEKWIKKGKWRELLPFVNCKIILKPLIGTYMGREKVPKETHHLTKLIRDMMRYVVGTRKEAGEDPSDVICDLWTEVSDVVKKISSASKFQNDT